MFLLQFFFHRMNGSPTSSNLTIWTLKILWTITRRRRYCESNFPRKVQVVLVYGFLATNTIFQLISNRTYITSITILAWIQFSQDPCVPGPRTCCTSWSWASQWILLSGVCKGNCRWTGKRVTYPFLSWMLPFCKSFLNVWSLPPLLGNLVGDSKGSRYTTSSRFCCCKSWSYHCDPL